MKKFKIPRARAVTGDVFYASGIPGDNEIDDPFTRIYQYNKERWGHADIPIPTQYIALYHRPEGGRIVVYASSKGTVFSPEPSFKSAPIIDGSLEFKKKGGRIAAIRQAGSTLLACGDNGQNYRRLDDGRWTPLDISLFDDYVDPRWVFAIEAQGTTGAEHDAYWDAHPVEKAESDRRVRLLNSGLMLMSIDGSSVNDVYMCGQDGAVYHWDGTQSRKVPVPTAVFLNDILVDDADTVWICGREGTLLRGNARQGFTLVPCEGRPDFNTVTRFRDKIYLSSYAGPRGVFVCDGRVRQLTTGPTAVFKDINTVDGVAEALWAFGLTSVARFDGTAWERIKMPKWSD